MRDYPTLRLEAN